MTQPRFPRPPSGAAALPGQGTARAARLRWTVLLSLLGLALWLVLAGDPASVDDGIARPVASAAGQRPVASRAARPSGAEPAEVPLERLRPRAELFADAQPPRTQRDLFKAGSWTPPPAPPQVPPTPPPAAPPLPYTYAGKKLEAGAWEVYLLRGEMAFIVREGSPLEEAYVVESIAPPTLKLRYRPLNELQTMDIGEGTWK